MDRSLSLEVIWVEVQPMTKNCQTELNYSLKSCPTFSFPRYLAGEKCSHSYIFCWACRYHRGGQLQWIYSVISSCNSQPLKYFDLVTILFSSLQQVLHQKLHRSFKNVKIVSNRMEFDQNGHLVSFKGNFLILRKELEISSRRCALITSMSMPNKNVSLFRYYTSSVSQKESHLIIFLVNFQKYKKYYYLKSMNKYKTVVSKI